MPLAESRERYDWSRAVVRCVDRDGRIYTAESETGVVHRHDARGHWLGSFRRPLKDVLVGIYPPHVAVRHDGHVFVGYAGRGLEPGDYVHFAADRTKLGDPIRRRGDEKWYFQPGSSRRWEVDDLEVRLVDPTRGTLKAHKRRTVPIWQGTGTAAIAPDGSLAVLEEDNRAVVRLYSADAQSVRKLAVPPGAGLILGLAYDGSRLILGTEDEVICLDVQGTLRWRFRPTEVKPGVLGWHPFFAGEHLLLYGGNGILYRYSLPK